MSAPRRAVLAVLPLAVLPLAVLTSCASGAGTAREASGQQTSATGLAASLHGVVPDHRLPRPDFRLTTTGGAPYDFAAATKGRVTLLYFGYTHCPDECPTTMHDVGVALRKLPADVRDQVDAVFVTSDPARDTAPVLRAWLAQFNPAIVGLTGTPAQVNAAERAAGVGVASREPVPSGAQSAVGDYAVEHAAALLVYGHQDRVVEMFLAGSTPEDYLADLPKLVRERTATS